MPTVLKGAAASEAGYERNSDVMSTVAEVIADIRSRGDEAVRDYSVKFDNWNPDSFKLSPKQIESIIATVARHDDGTGLSWV
jgi:sulfopropanediol 3-dehydrogenase